jgi:hypothetical protein
MASLPYDQGPDKWKKHFVAMARGEVRPLKNGLYIVGDGSNQKGGHPQVKVELVTPVAAAVDRAKAQLERENKEDYCYKEPTGTRRNNKRKRI